MIYMIIAIFFAVPIISVISWVLNLIKYCQAKRNSELTPEEIKPIKSNLIISSVIAFVLVVIIVGLIVLFAMGIAYM